jgi:hypothetical protein
MTKGGRTGIFRSLVRGWRNYPAWVKSLIGAIAFGVLTEYALIPYVLHGATFVRTAADNIADSMIRLGERIGSGNIQATPFIFVAVDDHSWNAWGNPLITPRHHIAKILAAVTAGHPAAVVLDIAIDTPDSHDGELLSFLRSYSCPPSKPPLILVRRIISPEDDGAPRPRANLVFDDVACSYPSIDHPNIHLADVRRPDILWGIPLFSIDGDAITRRWQLYQLICNDGRPELLPSVELLAAAAATGKMAAVNNGLKTLAPRNCLASGVPEHEVWVDFRKNVRVLLSEQGIGRITYSIGWKRKRAALGPSVSHGTESIQTPLVEVRPAAEVSKAADNCRPLDSRCPDQGVTGRIVVIGGSYKDNPDIRHTPLGLMPGAMVIINAIHALLEYGTPVELKGWKRAVASGLFILVVALCFATLRPIIASGLASAVIIVSMMLAVWIFKSGIVLDLAAPSAGVVIHRIFEELFEFGKELRHKKWGALLRQHPSSRRIPVKRLRIGFRLLSSIALPWALYPGDVRAQEAAAEVGIIKDYAPPKGQYKIVRGGESVPLTLASPIMNGDIIYILSEQGQVEIETFDEKSRIIKKADQPYIVAVELPERSPALQAGAGLLTWVGELYAGFQSEESSALLVTNSTDMGNKRDRLTARGSVSSTVADAGGDLTNLPGYSSNSSKVTYQDEAAIAGEQQGHSGPFSPKEQIRVPLLDKPQIIAAGRRRLALAWSGGSAPFSVQFLESGGLFPITKAVTTEQAWISDPVNLRPGSYEIKVRGKNSTTVQQTVTVIDPSALPSPAGKLDESLPADLRDTIRAAWLAAQGNGRFVLESYVQLPPLASVYRPADVLAQALERGAALPDTAP